jgi:hypothetical protein
MINFRAMEKTPYQNPPTNAPAATQVTTHRHTPEVDGFMKVSAGDAK